MMPTFHNPVRVDVIESGSGFPWDLLGGLVTAAAVRFLRRFMVVGWRQHAPRPALPLTVTAELAGERQAVTQPRQAIEGGQHVHFHFAADMPAGQVAAVIRQAITRPAGQTPVNLTADRRVS
jgi:hypothetical protein